METKFEVEQSCCKKTKDKLRSMFCLKEQEPEPVKDLCENEFFVVNLKVLKYLSSKIADEDDEYRGVSYLHLI